VVESSPTPVARLLDKGSAVEDDASETTPASTVRWHRRHHQQTNEQIRAMKKMSPELVIAALPLPFADTCLVSSRAHAQASLLNSMLDDTLHARCAEAAWHSDLESQ
jgi:hypothetical protein